MSDKLVHEYWLEAKEIIRKRRERGAVEFPTGLSTIDDKTGGFHKGEIWIVAGKTGSGKTSLALQMARNFADTGEHRVLFLTLEMKGWQLTLRMFSEMMRENHSDIEKCLIDIDPAKDKTYEAFLKNINFEIVEYGYTFEEVLKIFDKFYKDHQPDVIFLDFIQLVEWKQFKDERIAIMEYIRKLKELANKYNIGFVIVSQLRRAPSGADYNRPPDICDLMSSGSLEQTADKVLLIYKQIEAGQVKYILNLAKNRQGETFTSQIEFVGSQYRFEDIDFNNPKLLKAKQLFNANEC